MLLSGCSTTWLAPRAPEVKVVEKEFFHPARTSPLYLPAPKFEILTPEKTEKLNKEVQEGKTVPYVYVGLSWSEYLKLGQNMKEITEKFHKDSALLCHYRKELKEPECEKYLPKETNEQEKD